MVEGNVYIGQNPALTSLTALHNLQTVEGQSVRVEAISYSPFQSSPMIGSTKVFYEDQLLYTIDQYWRKIHYPIYYTF